MDMESQLVGTWKKRNGLKTVRFPSAAPQLNWIIQNGEPNDEARVWSTHNIQTV